MCWFVGTAIAAAVLGIGFTWSLVPALRPYQNAGLAIVLVAAATGFLLTL